MPSPTVVLPELEHFISATFAFTYVVYIPAWLVRLLVSVLLIQDVRQLFIDLCS